MDCIQHRSVEKIVKMLDRGLDPNFHDLETGGERGPGALGGLTEVQGPCVPSARGCGSRARRGEGALAAPRVPGEPMFAPTWLQPPESLGSCSVRAR